MKRNLQDAIILIIYSLYFIWICYINFFFDNKLSLEIITSSFNLIHCDHQYYQDVIFKKQSQIINGDLSNIFNIHDYGYSWLFWITQIIVTFPAFLLYKFIVAKILVKLIQKSILSCRYIS